MQQTICWSTKRDAELAGQNFYQADVFHHAPIQGIAHGPGLNKHISADAPPNTTG